MARLQHPVDVVNLWVLALLDWTVSDGDLNQLAAFVAAHVGSLQAAGSGGGNAAPLDPAAFRIAAQPDGGPASKNEAAVLQVCTYA